MAKILRKPARFKLRARIRNKRTAPDTFAARMALIDRIADLPGIDTIERNDDTLPCRVDIYLRREPADRVLKRRQPKLLCSLDSQGITLSGLDRWARYQVLANGWGSLVDDRVWVHLPRDTKEVETVWSVIERAYERFLGPVTPEAGSLVISTWDWPRFSRTSLQ